MRACPACGSDAVERVPVLHHMLCAYVGPLYDFMAMGDMHTCPKCRLRLNEKADDSETIGYSYRCHQCGWEQPEGFDEGFES